MLRSLALILLLTTSLPLSAREWLDSTGKQKTEAEYIGVEGSKVVLRKPNGKTIRVPLKRLSKKDQAFVRAKVRAAKAKTTKAKEKPKPTEEPLPEFDNPQGKLFGKDFEAVKVTLQGDRLTFGSDDKFVPRERITIMLMTGQAKLPGRKLNVRAGGRGLNPHVHLSEQESNKTEIVMDGYTMSLAFGKQRGNTIEGRIQLKIPSQNSELSGQFLVEEPVDYTLPPGDSEVPFIVATVKPPRSASLKDMISVGYLGIDEEGKLVTNSIGTNWSPDGHGSSMSHKPRVSSVITRNRRTLAQHVGLKPGTYYHYVVWNKTYLVGEVIEVKPDSRLKATLQLEPNKTGSLVVNAQDAKGDVFLVPEELQGKIGQSVSSINTLAYQLRLSADPEDGVAKFENLRPGKYAVVVGQHEKPVVISAGKSVEVTLE